MHLTYLYLLFTMKNEDIGKTILSICEQEVMPFIGDILLPHNTNDFKPQELLCLCFTYIWF